MNLSYHFALDPTSPSGMRSVGTRNTGWVDNCGYYRISLLGKKYLCHRIVYCLSNGLSLSEVPLVDHIDRNRKNNDPSNLRQLTKTENNRNRDAAYGVSRCKQTGKWKASNAGKWLGRHLTEDAARAAVIKAQEVADE